MNNPTKTFTTAPSPWAGIYESKDVASTLAITVDQARRLMSSGKIHAVKLGNRWLTLRKEIRKYSNA